MADQPPGVVKPTVGCASEVSDETSRRDCALRQLRYLDGQLNARYQELRRQLGQAESSAVLSTQREWLKRRDSACSLSTTLRDREAWLRHVAESTARAQCVLQMTAARVADLEALQNLSAAPPLRAEIVPQVPEPTAVAGDTTRQADTAGYLVRSSRTRRSGKHYFELVVDHGLVREKLEAALVARVNDGQRFIGTVYNVRPQDTVIQLAPGSSVTIVGGNLGDIRLPRVVIGVAVDLDNRRLYRHRDGAWLGGATPGSPHGVPLRANADFAAEVSSSVDLGPLGRQGIVIVNFGARPFERPPPTGYGGFDEPDRVAGASHSLAQPRVFAPGERVAGDAQAHWVRRYMEWVRSFPLEESPSADSTGFRCATGQAGPVWFLAGSRVTAPVVRNCEIPAGKVLLVPVVNSLAQVNPGKDAGCDRLSVSLRQFTATVADLRLKINGASVEGIDRHFLGTGCFVLRDVSASQTGLAVANGYWVFIRPLAPGTHELEFGGRFPTSGFEQHVKYVLQVR